MTETMTMPPAIDPAPTGLIERKVKALRRATPGLPAKPRVLVVGAFDDGLLKEIRSVAGSVTAIRVGREAGATPPDRPFSLTAEPCDLVVASGLLNGPADPSAWIDRLRRLAPFLWADLRLSDRETEPLPLLLDAPYDPSRPPRALAIDRFERLGLACRVAAEKGASGGESALAVACDRMDAEVGPPLLVHVHAPKNGGMTVKDLLDRSFPRTHLPLYLENPRDEQFPHRVRAALHANPGTEAISSHSFHVYPPQIGGRAALYFTLLRDPAERTLSYMRYCQKNWDTLSDEHKRMLPEGFRDMGVVEYIRWQAERLESSNGLTSNLQCQYFSRPNNLRMAQRVLRDFFFVGLTDRMALSLAVLKARLAVWGIELADPPAERVNATTEMYDKTLREAEDPSVRKFLERMSDDRGLVKWARARLEREAAMLGVTDPG